MSQPPIVFLIFNRPDVTVRTFAAIRAARPDQLLVVADGPRPGRSGEPELCARTRSIVDGVDWPCEVLRNFSHDNMGCSRRIATGLDWAFEQVEEAIILEDDCLPDLSFFRYCGELLKRYRTYERIMMISGNNFQDGTSRTPYSYYFSQVPNCWGWATWRRAWRHYDFTMHDWREKRGLSLIRAVAKNEMQEHFWEQCFDTKADTWHPQWIYCMFARNGLSIAPDVNLVSNIGLGHAAATNTVTVDDRFAVPSRAMEFPLRHPNRVAPCVRADQYEHVLMCGAPQVILPSRIRRRLLFILRLTQPLLERTGVWAHLRTLAIKIRLWPASNGLDISQPDHPFYRRIGRRCLRLIRPLSLPFLARLQARVSSGVDASFSAQVLRQVLSAQQAINARLGMVADTVQMLNQKVDVLTLNVAGSPAAALTARPRPISPRLKLRRLAPEPIPVEDAPTAQPNDLPITGVDNVQLSPPTPDRCPSFVDSLKAALQAGMPDSSPHDLIAPYQVDRNARIFWWKGEPYRAIPSARSAFCSHLFDSGVLPALIRNGLLTFTERTGLKITGYDLVLKQRRIPAVSYPFEWCSAMLKDAALLILELEANLRRQGLTLLDPHSWNVLFDGSRPVYVDIGSIVPIEEHPGWPQQNQFRQYFIYPLQLIAGGVYSGVARWLMQGIDPCPEILAFLGQIELCPHQNEPNERCQSAPTADIAPDEYDDLAQLRKEIESITFPPRQTKWSSCAPDLSDTIDWTEKEWTVDQVLAEIRPQTVVDIGCNHGWFSKLAVRYGSRVVAFDVDEPSIEALYRDAKAQSLPILPLVLDFVYATPAFGPGYTLYPSSADRLKSELVLAVALTHHLVFKRHLSFEQIVDGLKLYTRRWLLVEFVPPTDWYVSQLWSEETHRWYTTENFRAVLKDQFATVRELPSAPEPRLMFLCEV